MAEDRLLVFISYSRVDSDFAHRLRADLEASGFTIWIDTAKLNDQGGQEWLRLIQDAVDNCQAMVVIVSPDSIQSRYVHMEYHRAQTQNKLVIPVHYRTVTSAPIDLDLTQWLEFRAEQGGTDSYQTGLTSLIRSLSNVPATPRYPDLPLAPVATPLTISEGADIPIFQPVTSPPPDTPQELQVLMTAAYDARGKGDLASEQYYIQQIVAQDPSFRDGRFTQRLHEVTQEIETQRVQRLRSLAQEAVQEKQWRRAAGAWVALLDVRPDDAEGLAGVRQARVAHAQEALRDGEYDEAIGTWQAVLRATPTDKTAQAGLRTALRARADDAWSKADWIRAAESWETLRSLKPPELHASEYLDAIAQNQRGDLLYQSAQRSLAVESIKGAQVALTELYEDAPYYGDPIGIAPQLGVKVPPNLATTIEARIKQEEANEAAKATAEEEARRKANEAAKATAEEEARRKANEAAWAARETRYKAEQAAISKRKADEANARWWKALSLAMLLNAIPNYLVTAIMSAIHAGDWWTTAMFINSVNLAWMSLLLYGLLVGALVFVRWALRAFGDNAVTSASVFAHIFTIPGCWLIAIWLYTGFYRGVDWTMLGSIVPVSIGLMFFIVPASLVLAELG